MSSVNFAVTSNYAAGANKAEGRNPSDPNAVTTGVYGSAFELALGSVSNNDGTLTDTLTYKSYDGKTNGSFSAVSETGSGGDLSTAYSNLFAALQANGELNSETESQLKSAFGQLQSKSSGGSKDATVSGGATISIANGPTSFAGISSGQNNLVFSVLNDLNAQLQLNDPQKDA